jgi:hypothetical protein
LLRLLHRCSSRLSIAAGSINNKHRLSYLETRYKTAPKNCVVIIALDVKQTNVADFSATFASGSKKRDAH